MSYNNGEILTHLMVCEDCKVLAKVTKGKNKSLYFLKKKRCPLCKRVTTRFNIPKEKKDVMRFPREGTVITKEMKEASKKIEDCLKDLECPGRVIDVLSGPVVTEYIFEPERFTRVKKLKTLNEDVALRLNAEAVTIRRMAGKIGISVPKGDRQIIPYRDTIKNVVAHRYDMELPLNMGVTSTGEPYVEDLANFPHLLIGGSTGTGKSVFLNDLLTSLLYIRSPKELELYMIDPKSVELFPYKGIPHLKRDPVKDVYEALSLLHDVENEMRRRTNNLHVLKAKDIKELNTRIKGEVEELRKAGKHEDAAKREADLWPYILVVIDEMADLILAEKKDFINQMAKIAQMARAAGICIVAATQRPSVDVLPGKIKVNFPARASFRVTGAPDSKTILGLKGAETLLGKGDMFLISPDKSGLQRIHVPYCKPEDRDDMLKLSLEYGHVRSVPADAPVQPAAVTGKTVVMPKPTAK